ncbi:type I-E CRISPR-associated protein Cas7/Cse4/CasC [Saccharophagus degradans]|uniref:type I-E CRISPR-associated protein Cas7/Cse4/CasC n=1 Tax=Saccharophagus degradans TaxID=86304 RepID=UPI001C085B74|nr:type I-E CRISPR-associated protein Cas7/Cse4/CasC [Saccharophagus degradans]MBU2986771.1 type I-E CRISPR-associated protein Cas7/Cse4/CasC [Saccharophagus degradans]
MTNYINIHTLISHPSSMMNRDDSGLQKTAIFGGHTRARISSQCLKRAIRNSDIYKKCVDEMSIRTKRVDDLIALCKTYIEGVNEEVLVSVIENLGSKIKVEKDKDTGEKSRYFDAVQPYSIGAIRELVYMVEGGLALKDIKKTPLVPTLDVCLSGRMDASATERNVEGAMSVAHSFTTHAASIEVDWFTACDDLSTQGSGHIGSNEFSSGVFYRYASINLDLLEKNCKKEKEELIEVIKMIISCFAKVTPPAKEKTFAAHTFADCILVTKSTQPLSLANAFLKPIENNGNVMDSSIKALVNHFADLKNKYELEDEAIGMDVTGQAVEVDGIKWVSKLSEITV